MFSPLPPPVQGYLPRDSWSPVLDSHPDQRFAAYLRRGINHGFRIGVRPTCQLVARKSHHPSASAHADIIASHVREELASGAVEATSRPVHLNPIGIIPKPSQPGKFRLIVDLSAPRGASVNDGIPPELSSLSYPRVDQAAALIAQYGRGALIAKLDLQSAYRKIPVHPADQHLLGVQWQGVTYIDHALPFGLRSAPKLFTAVADGYAWALTTRGITDFVHYLDDFLFWAPPDSSACRHALTTALELGTSLGLPAAPHKVDGPTTSLTFLGIEMDTVAQQLRLPQEKLRRLKRVLLRWTTTSNPTKRQLQSLIGLLNHAASVIPPGRSFLRGLIEDMKRPARLDQPTRLTAEAKADIAWWLLFVESWNGVGLFPTPPKPASVTTTSDASGSWGCGAFKSEPIQFFQLQWPESYSHIGIAAKELLPMVASAAIWGKEWSGKTVLFRCDNMAAVIAVNSRSSRDRMMTHLLRCLFFFQAEFKFEYIAKHVPGKSNKAADALSRNRLDAFVSLFQREQPLTPVAIPPPLKELLLHPAPAWTSPHWVSLFRSFLQRV